MKSTAARQAAVGAAYVLYKRVASPVLHALAPGGSGGCLYQPTCSEYAALACAHHGFLRGTLLSLGRLLRCNPFSPGGWDPVPLRENGRPPA